MDHAEDARMEPQVEHSEPSLEAAVSEEASSASKAACR
jgi:hypothetical protein